MATTALIRYRDEVKGEPKVVNFCTVEFIGDDKEKFENSWNKIQYAYFEINEQRVKELHLEIDKLRFGRKIYEVNKFVEEFKLKRKIDLLLSQRFKDHKTIFSEIESFLKAQDFTLESQSTIGEQHPIQTWTYIQKSPEISLEIDSSKLTKAIKTFKKIKTKKVEKNKNKV